MRWFPSQKSVLAGGFMSAVRYRWGDPAVLLMGLHQTLECCFCFLSAKGLFRFSSFPADTTLGKRMKNLFKNYKTQ